MDQVEEFMVVGDQIVNKIPVYDIFNDKKLISLRNSLLIEEIKETADAYKNSDRVEEKDGIADIAVVTYGYLLTIGSHREKTNTYHQTVQSEILQKLFILYNNIELVSTSTENTQKFQFYSVSKDLNDIIDLIEDYASVIGETLSDLVTIVHTSNMTKFPKTIEEAELTLEKYANHEIYKGVYYKKCQTYDYYVVKSNNHKILKSINYKDPVWI